MEAPSQTLARTLLATFAALSPVLAAAQNTPANVTNRLYPNNLVVSRSVYDNNPANVTVGEILPPNCPPASGSCSAPTGAPYDGAYPTVFNNDLYDASFGITSKIYLDQLTLTGQKINSIEVPNSDQGIPASANHLVTSFSSKSELALNLSTDGKSLTFMGYVAPVNSLDVSNSNTPLVIDPTNPDGQTPTYRAVAKLGQDGHFSYTETNAYSGNNGRAAILNADADVFYTAGNAGNGSNPQPDGIILGAGAQFIQAEHEKEQKAGSGASHAGRQLLRHLAGRQGG